jgi:hypothetical protein
VDQYAAFLLSGADTRTTHIPLPFHIILSNTISLLLRIAALFPTFTSDEALMADFLAQVQLPFAHVEPNLAVGIRKQKTSKEQYAARRIKKLFKSSEAAFTGVDPKQVMIVTTCENLLRAARDAGMLTCKFRLPNGLRGQVSTHFTATGALEVQDALEELNGIAWRGTAHSSRTFF